MRIAVETLILAALGMADLIWTVWLIGTGVAVEANPVMAFYLKLGLYPFVAIKLMMIAGPLAGLEWVRVRRPRYVQRMLRLGIALYAGFYVIGFCHLNGILPGASPDSILRIAAR